MLLLQKGEYLPNILCHYLLTLGECLGISKGRSCLCLGDWIQNWVWIQVYYNTFHTIRVSSEKFMREDQVQIKSILFGGRFSAFTLFESEPSILNDLCQLKREFWLLSLLREMSAMAQLFSERVHICHIHTPIEGFEVREKGLELTWVQNNCGRSHVDWWSILQEE